MDEEDKYDDVLDMVNKETPLKTLSRELIESTITGRFQSHDIDSDTDLMGYKLVDLGEDISLPRIKAIYANAILHDRIKEGMDVTHPISANSDLVTPILQAARNGLCGVYICVESVSVYEDGTGYDTARNRLKSHLQGLGYITKDVSIGLFELPTIRIAWGDESDYKRYTKGKLKHFFKEPGDILGLPVFDSIEVEDML